MTYFYIGCLAFFAALFMISEHRKDQVPPLDRTVRVEGGL